jgi:hypothetical protein
VFEQAKTAQASDRAAIVIGAYDAYISEITHIRIQP